MPKSSARTPARRPTAVLTHAASPNRPGDRVHRRVFAVLEHARTAWWADSERGWMTCAPSRQWPGFALSPIEVSGACASAVSSNGSGWRARLLARATWRLSWSATWWTNTDCLSPVPMQKGRFLNERHVAEATSPGAGLDGRGEEHTETGATPRPVIDLDPTAMRKDDGLANRQPQPVTGHI